MASDHELTVVKWAGSVLRVQLFRVMTIKDFKHGSMEGVHMGLRDDDETPIEEMVIEEAGNAKVVASNLPWELRDLYDNEG